MARAPARPLNAASRAALQRRFAAIPERMKKAARDTLKAEAEAIVAEMKASVPVATGKARDSIRAVEDPEGVRFSILAGGPTTSRPVRNSSKGNAPLYDYTLSIEFGDVERTATPFFYPTWWRGKKRAKGRVNRALKKAMNRA